MSKKTCAFITLGCKVNQYETQAIRESIVARGYREVSSSDRANLYVINTCTVTSRSDDKSRQHIRRAVRSNPDARVVVTGCCVDADKSAVEQIEGVDYAFANDDKVLIADVVEPDGLPPHPNPLLAEERELNVVQDISNFEGHTRAFLKIEDGCDIFCSYCIIPYVRGRVRSKGPGAVVEEAENLVSNGYKEIVLTGIHLGAYGRDLGEGESIADVLRKLEDISGLQRIRLSSIEVNELTDEIIDIMAGSEKICPHLHFPLQSGNDYILRRMNRRYTVSQYLRAFDKIRAKIVSPSFSTDVMVGFPGESEEAFQDTINVCREAGFSRTHIFPYSIREGTPAAKMPNHCKPHEIWQRKKLLESEADRLALEYKQGFVGTTVDVLVETKRDKKTGKLCGYTDRYIKVFMAGSDDMMNTILPVKIKKAYSSFAEGDVCREPSNHYEPTYEIL